MEGTHFQSANNAAFSEYKFLLCKRLFWHGNNVFYIERTIVFYICLYFDPVCMTYLLRLYRNVCGVNAHKFRFNLDN